MDQRHSILLVRSKKLLRNVIALMNQLCFCGVFLAHRKGYDLVGSVLDMVKKRGAVKYVFCDLYLIQTICQEVIVSTDQK